MLESLTDAVYVQTSWLMSEFTKNWKCLNKRGLVIGSLGVLADSLYPPWINAERVQTGHI